MIADAPITKGERRLLAMLREADAVFIYTDKGQRVFSWFKHQSDTWPIVDVQYGKLPDGKTIPIHLTIKMGMKRKAFETAVAKMPKVPPHAQA